MTTGAANDVTQTSATIAGTATNPGFTAGTVSFEYGTSTAYGSTTTPDALPAGASASPSAALTSLTPDTTYHYRVMATNDEGTATGADQTFQTPAIPTVQVLVTNRLKPASDGGRFDLLVNGNTVAAATANGGQGTTRPAAGSDVTVSEAASGATKLSNYDTKIDCGSAGKGTGREPHAQVGDG